MGALTPTTSQLPVSLWALHPISPSLCFLSLQDPSLQPIIFLASFSSASHRPGLLSPGWPSPAPGSGLRTAPRGVLTPGLMLALSSCLSVFLC